MARYERDSSLWNTLYGAKKIPDVNAEDPQAKPSRVSYKEFFDEETASGAHIIIGILKDLALALGCILTWLYFMVFLGGHLMVDGTFFHPMKQKVLAKYESQNAVSTESAVTRRLPTMIVSYKVDSKTYKKEMKVPAVKGSSRWVRTRIAVPDEPELIYLPGQPKSAELKCRIERRSEEGPTSLCKCLFGLVYFGIQISVIIIIDRFNWTTAGDIATGSLVAGFVGNLIQYHFFFLKKLLHGAKEVTGSDPDTREFVDEAAPKVDMATAVAIELPASEATWSETDEDSAFLSETNRFKKLVAAK
jgi:hypothetical protein